MPRELTVLVEGLRKDLMLVCGYENRVHIPCNPEMDR